jgi:hypothetical protein
LKAIERNEILSNCRNSDYCLRCRGEEIEYVRRLKALEISVLVSHVRYLVESLQRIVSLSKGHLGYSKERILFIAILLSLSTFSGT